MIVTTSSIEREKDTVIRQWGGAGKRKSGRGGVRRSSTDDPHDELAPSRTVDKVDDTRVEISLGYDESNRAGLAARGPREAPFCFASVGRQVDAARSELAPDFCPQVGEDRDGVLRFVRSRNAEDNVLVAV